MQLDDSIIYRHTVFTTSQLTFLNGLSPCPTLCSICSSTLWSLLVHSSPHCLKSQIVLFAIHLLASGINFLTHYTNPILLTPCISRRNHQLLSYRYCPSLSLFISSSITPATFVPELKIFKYIFSINPSNHRKLWLLFACCLTFFWISLLSVFTAPDAATYIGLLAQSWES